MSENQEAIIAIIVIFSILLVAALILLLIEIKKNFTRNRPSAYSHEYNDLSNNKDNKDITLDTDYEHQHQDQQKSTLENTNRQTETDAKYDTKKSMVRKAPNPSDLDILHHSSSSSINETQSGSPKISMSETDTKIPIVKTANHPFRYLDDTSSSVNENQSAVDMLSELSSVQHGPVSDRYRQISNFKPSVHGMDNKRLLQSRPSLLGTVIKNDLLVFGYCRVQTKRFNLLFELSDGIINYISQYHSYSVEMEVIEGWADIQRSENNKGYLIEADSSFSTIVCNIGVKKRDEKGKYYYEFIVVDMGLGALYGVPQLAQIGWCDDKHAPNEEAGVGVGDDSHSWAYDGGRQCKWHKGRRKPYGKKWTTNDVVGCCVDIVDDKNNIFDLTYYLNGVSLGIAFKNCQYTGHLYSAGTYQTDQIHGITVFDKEHFQYLPNGYEPII